ncbi:uncharacterized protein TRIADDRAFT_19171 [Trichoplax adhaerens]|uniref:15-oxoprostaglandin 13-reductase n=1 Tax=Trichoplax adhaerens TaxID=10228 RepID=B3RL05_TRIAD|nr:hypothetical protein TRIADDRAFT_19171 [Trichoplax adhaerens]EDV29464.1 hypothetical protein TRIADDRAFT_19171 [Trichoplax adhaerens]|eukprot:XP_002108666.1 hypothetical protein TRIADDRAFT_19171 [Trichoplax adhaerens]
MAAALPRTFRRILCEKFSPDFRQATRIVDTPMVNPGAKELLIKNRYLGINASDINFTAGRYFNGDEQPPFGVGFEAIGEIVALGNECQRHFKVGNHVAYMQNGSFAEYMVVPAREAFPIPSCNPEYIPFMVSGLTASISLDQLGDLKSGETVLVTAAAGGTGQFAVQLAKAAGCHVIGTCSSSEKAEFLRNIGCDRPVNYKTENLDQVLKKEYPKGIDVVYESIGAEMFNICLENLAIKGRLIVIGYISGYQTAKGVSKSRNLIIPPRLLSKSSSLRGFLLFHYVKHYGKHFQKLANMYHRAELKSSVDLGQQTHYKGLDSIAEAIDYMYSGKNKGKIIVELPKQTSML